MKCECDELRDKIRNMTVIFRNDCNDALGELATLRAKLAEVEGERDQALKGFVRGIYMGGCYCHEDHVCSPCTIKIEIAKDVALAEMTERARVLGEALTYIAGSVGARDHERRIAREALEAITAREVVKE